MIVSDKWLVLEDGCVMNIDTGCILWETKNGNGQPCYKLVDDKGKVNFFLKSTLMDMNKDEMMVEKAIAHMNDYTEWGEHLNVEHIQGTPKIVEEFEKTLQLEHDRAQRELHYSIEKGKPKQVKIAHKEIRDNVKTIMDFIDL